MTHIAITESLDGKNVDWLENMRDERYRPGSRCTQESLADHSSEHRTCISDIERGVRKLTIVLLDRIAKRVPAS